MGHQVMCSGGGSSLPPDAPEGLCLHCLLRLSMTTDSTQDSISTVITKGSAPTLLEQTRYQESSRKIDVHEAPGRYSHPQEAQLTGQLEHPSIIPVYEMGKQQNDRSYPLLFALRPVTICNFKKIASI